MKTGKRDLYLDFYRGIAVLSVIFIHTVYWSGEIYLSGSIFLTLALLIDVPLFVFLSGWSAFYTANIQKTFDNLIKVWIQYVLFMALIDLYCGLVLHPNSFSPATLLQQMVFQVETPDFPVIAGSLWFVPMWIPVALCGSVVTVFLNCTISNRDDRNKYLYNIDKYFYLLDYGLCN